MNEDEITKRISEEVIDLAASFELKAVAIWTTDTETEIFFGDENPDEEQVTMIEQLSQSFLGW